MSMFIMIVFSCCEPSFDGLLYLFCTVIKNESETMSVTMMQIDKISDPETAILQHNYVNVILFNGDLNCVKHVHTSRSIQ